MVSLDSMKEMDCLEPCNIKDTDDDPQEHPFGGYSVMTKKGKNKG